jgi:hypothetical protein
MMKKRSNGYGKMSESSTTTTSSTSREEETEWEMRPGGMMVQKRSESKDIVSAPNIRLRVAYGALRHEISVNSQATFGKMIWIYLSTFFSPINIILIFCLVAEKADGRNQMIVL